MYPARGQTVIVRNEAPYMAAISGTDDGEGEVSYVMTRASGGGTVLGGTYQPGQWESQPDHNTAQRIMRRAVALVPELVADGRPLDVVRHAVGLRPARDGGVRLESERVDGVRPELCDELDYRVGAIDNSTVRTIIDGEMEGLGRVLFDTALS